MHLNPGAATRLIIALAAGLLSGWIAARAARAFAASGAEPGAEPPIAIATAAGAALFAWAAIVVAPPLGLAMSFVLGGALLTLALVDLVSMRLPDLVTLPLLAAGLAASLVMPQSPIWGHLAGAAGGYAVLALLAWGYRRWRGVDGIGLGDAKLLGAAGAWLGWQALPSVVLIACAAAFGWVAVRLALRRPDVLRARLAFGAPLCLATWIVWLYGPLGL